MFQQAVKDAKEKGLGIWNKEDPLLEQPFEFRAREQKKGSHVMLVIHLQKPTYHLTAGMRSMWINVSFCF
ncbi:hypothetical protein OE903_10750 [Bacillus sp. B6(2022)]|nr:hypothetical protein [Bacillus sp. B6(2022)]